MHWAVDASGHKYHTTLVSQRIIGVDRIESPADTIYNRRLIRQTSRHDNNPIGTQATPQISMSN